jgi:hypothetical protein
MRLFCCLIGLCMFFANCKNKTQVPITQIVAADEGEMPSADFLQFYEQFHKDSIFQMNHIGWPLMGETTMQSDSGRIYKEPIEWQQSTWEMHRNINISTGEFQRSWKLFGDLMVTERIKGLESGFRMERRFAKASNGDWSLIFYSDM